MLLQYSILDKIPKNWTGISKDVQDINLQGFGNLAG